MQAKKIIAMLVLPVTLGVVAVDALAEDDMPPEPKNLSVTVGLRIWDSQWQTWGGFSESKAGTANPTVTVKYKNMFASLGGMPRTTFNVPDAGTGTTIAVTRQETDVSVGYYLMPQLAVTLGYKYTKQKWGTTDFVWKIPAIGLSAASAIQGTRMFMYGNAAFGAASISVTGVTGYYTGGLYTTSELGLGYAFTPSFRLTAGYKYQVIPTTYPNPAAPPPTLTQYDTTRGFIVGGSYTF